MPAWVQFILSLAIFLIAFITLLRKMMKDRIELELKIANNAADIKNERMLRENEARAFVEDFRDLRTHNSESLKSCQQQSLRNIKSMQEQMAENTKTNREDHADLQEGISEIKNMIINILSNNGSKDVAKAG
jgi:CBS domain containing-hemolysin-like protein